MVELLADRWGVDADEQGKTVWFELGEPDAGAPDARPVSDAVTPPASFTVHLQDLPVDLLLAAVQYGDTVLRELVLLSIGSDEGPGPEGAPPTSKIDLGPLLAEVEEAQAAGRQSVDVVLGWPEGAGAAALERLALVDEADRMAREGSLLTPAAVPEVGLCRRWVYGEIGRQENGAAATSWTMPEPLEPVVGPARLPEAELRRLEALTRGAVVADDANRILYVNALAGKLLGWEGDALVGRRLACIVPPELRAAHLAGFTRYLLTGEARILGRRTRLPALRRDGSIIEVDIVIEMVDLGDRQVFRATFG
jgi:PAS domain S-box-containing protein